MSIYKRKFGQHFLKTKFLNEIVPLLDVKGKYVLEIGVGRGNLTKKIAPLVRKLTGYERDRYLYRIAKKELESYENVEIKYGDALKINPAEYDIIIGNLPFSISSKFIEWIIINRVTRAIVILQKDFVDKLLAKPGDKKYVALSVLAQYFFQINPLLIIPPSWFSPPPRVFSTLTDFKRRRNNVKAEELIKKVKGLFSTKRKLAGKVFGKDELRDKRIYELSPETILNLVQDR